jgi:hypothetical protein
MNDRRRLFWLMVVATIALVLSVVQFVPTAIQMVTGVRVIRADMLIIEDRAGDSRIMLTTLGSGAPQMTLSDAAGNVRAELALTPLGLPGLSLMSKEGKTVVRVSTHMPGEQPDISIFDAEGRHRWRVYLDADGVLSVTTIVEPDFDRQ